MAGLDLAGDLPGWLLYVGVGALGAGLLVALFLLALMLAPATTVADRVTAYTDATRVGRAPTGAPGLEQGLSQATGATAQMLGRSHSLEARITARLERAGSELKPAEWVLVQGACLVGALALGLLLGAGNPLVVLTSLLLGVLVPWLWLGHRGGKRLQAFNAALPETLQLISGSLSAGLSLAQSLDTVVREGNEPIAGELRRVLVETRLGVPLEDALEGVTERFESKDFGWVVMAIRIQRQVGGNLAELLDTVATTMREREHLRRQVSTLSAEGRLSAWVLGGLPPVFLLYLALTNADYVRPLWTTGMGVVMLVGAAVWLTIGAFAMSRMVKVEV